MLPPQYPGTQPPYPFNHIWNPAPFGSGIPPMPAPSMGLTPPMMRPPPPMMGPVPPRPPFQQVQNRQTNTNLLPKAKSKKKFVYFTNQSFHVQFGYIFF